MIPKEIKPLLSSPHHRLVRVFLQTQFIEGLIKRLYRLFQLPPCRGKYQYVVHIPDVLNIHFIDSFVQIKEIKSTQKR